METAPDAPQESSGAQALLSELEARVQDVVRASSWWERHGVDCAILALSLLALPPGEGHGDMGTRGQGHRNGDMEMGTRGRGHRDMGTQGWGYGDMETQGRGYEGRYKGAGTRRHGGHRDTGKETHGREHRSMGTGTEEHGDIVTQGQGHRDMGSQGWGNIT